MTPECGIDKETSHWLVLYSDWPDYAAQNYNQIAPQLSLAWDHAHREGYLYKDEPGGSSKITEAGITYAQTEIRLQSLSQLNHLHPVIIQKVSAQFLAGKNSDAIGLAFNEIEDLAKTKAWPNGNPPVQNWIGQAFDSGNLAQGKGLLR